MKKINNIFRFFGLAACMGMTMTSCDLDLLPLNEVVLENFWTNKDDVDKVLTSCYVGMQEGGWVERAIIWGEVRSDNIAAREGSGTGGTTTPVYLQNIIKGNLKQNNSACQWGAYYKVINYCNTLLHYAPQVASSDPNITPGILAEIMAQAKAIRALNYFYLIRTFKDVPFSFEPSIDDTQEYRLEATKGETILDALISDLEGCKNDARIRYATYEWNSAKITRNAIYALLADMYLWKASDINLDAASQMDNYKKCIECCDYIIQNKIDEYQADKDGKGLQRAVDPDIYRLYGYPLLREDYGSGGAGTTSAAAYSQIFGGGNSFESIFELTYGHLDNDIKNMDVANMYGYTNTSGSNIVYLGASTKLLESKPSQGIFSNSETSLFTTYSDYRTVTGFIYDQSATSYYEICKYVEPNREGFVIGNTGWDPGTTRTTNRRTNLTSYEPWIIYRLSDVMLMRAEAEVQVAALLDPAWTPTSESPSKARKAAKGSSLSTADEYMRDAFDIACAVYMRSNPVMKSTPNAGPTMEGSSATVKDVAGMITLVENERHRELLFEGKRYYDLVRRARREGNTTHINQAIQTKFDEAPRAFIIKMAQLDFMYMPYAESELKSNPNLHQNPVYAEDEKTTKN